MGGINKAELASDTEALATFNRNIVSEFRFNKGSVAGLPGGEILLLHTTGARSGKPRMTPLAYLTVDDRMYVAGSFLGSAKDPAWVHNLRAHPQARVEVGTDTYGVDAHEVTGDERHRLYAAAAQLAPVLAEYQTNTERVIPLFELRRT